MIGLNTRMEQDLVQNHNAKVRKTINLYNKNEFSGGSHLIA